MCRPHKPNEVWGIKLLCDSDLTEGGDEGQRFTHELVTTDHPVFKYGELCPVTGLFGIPLLIYSPMLMGRDIDMRRLNQDHPDPHNQPAVYLRIEPHDGFVPIHWSLNNPGPCTVVRKDRKPLMRATIETIRAFHAELLDCFGYPEEDGWAHPSKLMTPATFQMFSRNYYKEQDEKGRLGFDGFFTPL